MRLGVDQDRAITSSASERKLVDARLTRRVMLYWGQAEHPNWCKGDSVNEACRSPSKSAWRTCAGPCWPSIAAGTCPGVPPDCYRSCYRNKAR